MTDTHTSAENTSSSGNLLNYIVIGGLIVAAFFGAYRFAVARGSASTAVAAQGLAGQASVQGGGSSSGAAGGQPACACCGGGGAPTSNGITGDPVEGAARLSGGVQSITVNVAGTYSPNVLKLKAGVPAKVTFGQSSGCTGEVISQDLGFQEDLTAGPRTVSLPALKPGTYGFSCGMGMVFGKIVVE